MSGDIGSAVADNAHANRTVFGRSTEDLLIAAFRRAAASVPAQATLLREGGADPDAVVDFESFSRLCPVRAKANTFHRFSLDELSVGGQLPELGDVLTSSGHGGVFSFGVSTREQMAGSSALLDGAFDAAFAVKTRRTLAVNCLPMGVVFGSHVMTVANVSVREDMALALVRAFGHRYDQVMLALDPLFAKRLVDHARESGLDWTRYRVNAVIGEEIFGEHFRDYLSRSLGLDADDPDRGYICSSFGVGELGLHLCYETPATIAVRRALRRHPDLRAELLGDGAGDAMPVPMILAFNPGRTFLEVLDRAKDGFGRLTVSMLGAGQVLPMLRYQPGDVAAILDSRRLAAGLARRGIRLPAELPPAILALRGRDREALPNGSHVGLYKDALYARHAVADRLTGAVRLVFDGGACTMHVQLAGDSKADASLERDILEALPAAIRPAGLVCWPRRSFPFGMTLDYERKFTYYAPGNGERHRG